ncbi:phenylacetate--CoA ligase family protein [Ectothiorhodospira marina]|uniref:Phenylacetate-CoA ligase n=1 Tax=Ectothiorhodospira marina TaxID=1396821 RepID=A0A1H7ICQ5_9GAMM|nr:phenylacetate--CoA ligase family protein [Ectothiorhodospira marina]SEK60228.1 phenylacetate-CoA ligase [Ectothiorhodospira marina]
MDERLTRFVLLPLHERLRGRGTMSAYAGYHRLEQLDASTRQEMRWQRLQALLTHCQRHVPYYKETLSAAGLRDMETLTPEGFRRLAVLTRHDIRNHREDLVAPMWRGRLIPSNTGGSTGEPLTFYSDKVKESRHNAQKYFARSWFGVLPGQRQLDFWGSPIELGKQTRLVAFKNRWLLNLALLSAFDLTDARLQGYAAYLASFKPRLIYGYPTVIYRMALWLLDHPQALGNYRPALVSCTSEMLLDHQRQAMQTAFGCPVVNEYGSRDGGLVAHECPFGHLHVMGEHVHVEVDEPDAEGVGELLVTNLDGYGMPLVRYRIGDRGSLNEDACPCGRPGPLLGRLEGRSNDFLVGRDGKTIHSLAPVYVLREWPKLRQFRIYQRPDHSLDVQLVCSQSLSDAELATLREKLQAILDEPVAVRFEFPEAILPERSGKYRWVLSEACSGRFEP